jgi:predicted TIM-barrel fold metal-dependent hydrolase
MADLEFVDTHVHFWNLGDPVLRYDWLGPDTGDDPDLGNYDAIKSRRYEPEDFLGGKVVHVQAAIGTADPVEETVWLQKLADRLEVPQGIVAYVDLAAPDTDGILARHAGHSNLRGVRDLRYDDYLSSDVWRRGYALLEGYGLVCCDDPVVEGMADAAELARSFPAVTYCVDHAGFPRQRDPEYFQEWRRGMREIASVENTVVKISGLGMADHRWTVDSLRRWVLECIDAWGPSRAFFGTNWPVDRLYSSYVDVLDAYAELISGLPEAQQAALFSGNANRVFRLA